jgi:hypothetical protein
MFVALDLLLQPGKTIAAAHGSVPCSKRPAIPSLAPLDKSRIRPPRLT